MLMVAAALYGCHEHSRDSKILIACMRSRTWKFNKLVVGLCACLCCARPLVYLIGVLAQETPLRVAHRRSLMVRPKVIHSMVRRLRVINLCISCLARHPLLLSVCCSEPSSSILISSFWTWWYDHECCAGLCCLGLAWLTAVRCSNNRLRPGHISKSSCMVTEVRVIATRYRHTMCTMYSRPTSVNQGAQNQVWGRYCHAVLTFYNWTSIISSTISEKLTQRKLTLECVATSWMASLPS